MKAKRKFSFLQTLPALGLFFFARAAFAQVTGELVEPDVMLLVDTSASMDWADNVPTDWQKSRTEWSIESCERINAGQTDYGKTSWQKLITAFLGGVNTDILKCVHEPNFVRPSLHAYAENDDLLEGFLDDKDNNGVPDNISEFRKTSWPHFRLISCEDQYWNQNRSDRYQCFDKSDPSEYNSSGFNKGFYCLYDDEKVVDGITTCKNLNPQAGPRFANGVISRYENLARFGIMTYDNVPSCLSESCDAHDKLWDYGVCRNWICQGDPEEGGDISSHVCEAWNAGARGPVCGGDSCSEVEKSYSGAIGGMVRIQHNIPPAEQNERVRKVLETIEPLFCSPLAAMLDDAGYYYATDKSVLPAGTDPDSDYRGTDKYFRCRRKVAVMISDGQPTRAFEFKAGSCSDNVTKVTMVSGVPTPDTGVDVHYWEPKPQDDSYCDKGYIGDNTEEAEPVVDCPWRSTPEEASELFQVGETLLDELKTPATDDDLPIFLVVVGYNVPEIDCSVYPDKCIPYSPGYYEQKRCWEGLPPCPPDVIPSGDAGVACSYECKSQTECTAANGMVHADMSCSGSDVCCEPAAYTCTYDCVPSTECTASGGAVINGQTCADGKVCCDIPVYTCAHDCMPSSICPSIGGTEITGETCPSGETCCDPPDIKYGFSVWDTGAKSIDLTNSYVNSFDSEAGAYGAGNIYATATVSTNSTAAGGIKLSSNSTVGGDAYVGVGGDPDTVIEQDTGSSVAGQKLVLPENVAMPTVQAPSGMPASEGDKTDSGSSLSWTADKHFHNLTFTGVTVTVSGIVRVWCEGNFTMNAGSIAISDDSALFLYIGGNFKLDNSAKLNTNPADPDRLITVMLGSGDWQIKNGSEIYTIGLQPNGGLKVDSADYYGAYLGESITGTNSGFHMDLKAVESPPDTETDAGADIDADSDADTDTSSGTGECEFTCVDECPTTAWTEPRPDMTCAGKQVCCEETCYMSPRQFLNEVACQGWPYQPQVVFGNHVTNKKPPWINPPEEEDEDGEVIQFCEPEGYSGDPDVYICRDNERAMFVNDPMKLQQAIDLVLGSLSPPTWATRTDLVAWNVQLSEFYEETATQYEFRTGYVVPYGRPWRGVLTRYDWSCKYQNDYEKVNPEFIYRDVPALLDTQKDREDGRNIYSVKLKSDGILSDTDYSPSDPTVSNILTWINQAGSTDFYEVRKIEKNGTTPPGDNDYNDCDFFGPNDTVNTTGCEARGEVRDVTSKNILERGLADIYNSTPAILEPPRGNVEIRSYAGYRDENMIRHPYLFVGTNDGVLHAFDVEEMGKIEAEATVERFGYIPRSVLGQIKDQYPISIVEQSGEYSISEDTETGLFQHKWLLDGSPIARDMLIARAIEQGPTLEDKGQWRAVVVGGLGKGGRGYYALDVTKSVEAGSTAPPPKLLWEISRDARLYGNNSLDGDEKQHIDKMEFPLSKPALAYVPDAIGGVDGPLFHVAAAVLPGGYNSDPTITTGVYIVRLGDGKVLKYFEPGAPGDTAKNMCTDDNGTDDRYVAGLNYDSDDSPREAAQLIGEPLVLQGSRYGSLASEVLVSDDRGRIWIIENLDNKDKTKWCMRLYFDTLVAWHFPYQNCIEAGCAVNPDCFQDDCCNQTDPPSGCAPSESTRNMNSPRVMILGGISMARDDKNNPVLIFGTGQYDGLSLWNRNRIFSITDILEKDENNLSYHIPKVNWWIGDFGVTKSDLTFPITDSEWNDLEEANRLWLTDIQNEMSNTYYNPTMDSDTCLSGEDETTVKPAYFYNIGEKLIGRPTIFNDFAYFTTFIPIEDPANYQDACEAGTSRIWGIKYNAKLCKTAGECKQVQDYTLDSDYIKSAFNSIVGGFHCDEEIAPTQWKLFEDYPGNLLSAVQVVRRPDCVGRGDVFELAAQMKNPEATVPNAGTPPKDTIKTAVKKLDRGGGIEVVMLRFDSWSLVFE
jgi:hypothetical protein